MSTAKERVEDELSDLNTKHESLCRFLVGDASDNIAKPQLDLLTAQASIMAAYCGVLEARLTLWVDV